MASTNQSRHTTLYTANGIRITNSLLSIRRKIKFIFNSKTIAWKIGQLLYTYIFLRSLVFLFYLSWLLLSSLISFFFSNRLFTRKIQLSYTSKRSIGNNNLNFEFFIIFNSRKFTITIGSSWVLYKYFILSHLFSWCYEGLNILCASRLGLYIYFISFILHFTRAWKIRPLHQWKPQGLVKSFIQHIHVYIYINLCMYSIVVHHILDEYNRHAINAVCGFKLSKKKRRKNFF